MARGAAVGVLALVASLSSCSEDRPPLLEDLTPTVAGAAGTAGGAGGTGAPGNVDVDTYFAACASSTTRARKGGADLYVMLDYSESMGLPAGATDRWVAVTTALRKFFAAPASTGLGVGIQYFGLPPVDLTSAETSICDPAAYASPDVEIGELPGNAAKLEASLDAHAFPRTNTPIGPALAGAIAHARAWATAHPERRAAVLLATDGEPNGCSPTDVASIAGDIALVGAQGNPPVITYVVGVGDLVALDAIAAAGGTQKALLATGDDIEAELLAALEKIRKASLPCTLAVPVPAEGALDVELVNVTYHPQGLPDAEIVVRRAGPDDCLDRDGWYYDDPTSPTVLVLCPATCQRVASDGQGALDIVLGCQSLVDLK